VRDVWPGDAQDFDAFMHDATADPSPATIHTPGHWVTRGGQEYSGEAPWRLSSGHVLDLEGGTIELDPDAVTDDVLKAESPIHVVSSAIGWAAGKTGEDAWVSVPIGEGCRNGTIVCNHSRLAERARALGVSLRISGAVLQGHSAVIEDLDIVDCGALGYESFPAKITGALSGYDRHALSTVDPGHMFDEGERVPSEMRNVSVGGFVSHASDAQVTCFMIDGALTNDQIADPWAETGNWREIYRRSPAIRKVRGVVIDGGSNLFQLATIYQCKGGEIDTPYCRGFHAGVYGDYCATFDLDVHHGDLEALRPVAQLLSPTPMPLAAQFSAHRLKVRSSQLRALPTDSNLHAALYLNNLPPYMDQRVIEDVTADDNDFIMVGAPKAGNVAVRARGIDGLRIMATNRFHGFTELYDIDSSNTDVQLPLAPPSRRGCGRWFHR
jgi:hypothetical protein